MLEALQEKEQEHVLHLQGIKIQCATNGKMSNKQHEMLDEANKMQEKTKEKSKIRKKNYLESNHAIASADTLHLSPLFYVGLHKV